MKEYIKKAKKRYGDSIYDLEAVDAFIEGAKWQQEQMEKLKDFDTWKKWKNKQE